MGPDRDCTSRFFPIRPANLQVELAPEPQRTILNFSATIRHAGPISIVEVAGRLTSFEGGTLRSSIAQLLKEGRKQIVLNLSRLNYLDSSGIGDLVQTYMSVIRRGGEMKVVGLTEKVEEILKITKLHQVFQEFQDEQSAMRSFPSSGGKPIDFGISEPAKN